MVETDTGKEEVTSEGEDTKAHIRDGHLQSSFIDFLKYSMKP